MQLISIQPGSERYRGQYEVFSREEKQYVRMWAKMKILNREENKRGSGFNLWTLYAED